jgi:hypothetical protein
MTDFIRWGMVPLSFRTWRPRAEELFIFAKGISGTSMNFMNLKIG